MHSPEPFPSTLLVTYMYTIICQCTSWKSLMWRSCVVMLLKLLGWSWALCGREHGIYLELMGALKPVSAQSLLLSLWIVVTCIVDSLCLLVSLLLSLCIFVTAHGVFTVSSTVSAAFSVNMSDSWIFWHAWRIHCVFFCYLCCFSVNNCDGAWWIHCVFCYLCCFLCEYLWHAWRIHSVFFCYLCCFFCE